MDQQVQKDRISKVVPKKSKFGEAKLLSKSWSSVLLELRVLKEMMRYTHFTKASEASKFADRLLKLEEKSLRFAGKASSILGLGDRDDIDEIVEVKAIPSKPWIVATVKTKPKRGAEMQVLSSGADEGFATVRSRLPDSDRLYNRPTEKSKREGVVSRSKKGEVEKPKRSVGRIVQEDDDWLED